GLTARIRIATALAGRKHRVTMICNCPRRSVHRGVSFVPLDEVRAIACDALLIHSSGGALDITPLQSLSIEARLRILVMSGVELPRGAIELARDAIYLCSNFVRTKISQSGIAPSRTFVTHYGVNRWNWMGWLPPFRNRRRLIYTSHPSKGFDAA